MEDFYELLGVNEDASIAEIRTAHRKMALLYHPDSSELDRQMANDRMVLINLAWETLRDAKLRLEYDSTRRPNKSTSASKPRHEEYKQESSHGVRMVAVVSSMISEIGHDGIDQLHVLFAKGGYYAYFGVPYSIYEEILHAESKGRALIRLVINGRFRYQRLRN